MGGVCCAEGGHEEDVAAPKQDEKPKEQKPVEPPKPRAEPAKPAFKDDNKGMVMQSEGTVYVSAVTRAHLLPIILYICQNVCVTTEYSRFLHLFFFHYRQRSY